VLLAVAIAATLGALVALPVLRLTGLYLALATIAFGQLMDNLVFKSDKLYAFGKSLPVERVSLFGYDFSDTGTYVFFMVLVFALLAMVLLAVRRGAIGRLLIALRDSPAACGTLGLNQRWLRVALFAVSAGVAGLGGAFLAGLHEFSTADDFQTMYSLQLLLAVSVAGVTTMTGAFSGGLLLMLLPVLAATNKSLAGLALVVLGVGAIMLGRDPNGLSNMFYRAVRGSGLRVPLPQRARSFAAPEPSAPAAAEADSRSEKQVAGHGVA
jgi:branched-chain amino acid transport system permease protein